MGTARCVDENGHVVHGNRTVKDWAARLSKLMNEAEFHEFVAFYEECDDVDLFDALTEIDAVRYPEDYADADDAGEVS